MKANNSKKLNNRIKILQEKIELYRNEYHLHDNDVVKPEVLDSLKRELVILETQIQKENLNKSPSNTISGGVLPGFKKIKHQVRQWSFNDAFTKEDIQNWYDRIKREINSDFDITAELKIDGFKIIITYVDGILKTAATRGDGQYGEDVTQNIKTIKEIPHILKQKKSLTIEGEVWMGEKELNRLNKIRKEKGEKLFANPRNVASGTIRQLDSNLVNERELHAFFYDISLSQDPLPNTQIEELTLIKDLGLTVNPYHKIVKNVDEIMEFWSWANKHKKDQDYWIDGIVLKVNNRSYQEELGYTGKSPRFGIAFKFPAEESSALIEDIIVQVGRTGVLTPVAVLSPTLLAGSVVSRATLHNQDEIERLDVRIGDTVVLRKAGDIIPEVVEVLKDFRNKNAKKYIFPKKCPECKQDVSVNNTLTGKSVAIYCKNNNCPAIISLTLRHFVSKQALNIVGMGDEIIERFYKEGLIKDISDIFNLQKEDLLKLERFGEKSVDNLLQSINNSKKVTLSRFIYGLGISSIGIENATLIARTVKTIDNFMNTSYQELESLDGIGPVGAQNVIDYLNNKKNISTLKKVIDILDIEDHKDITLGTVFKGKICVITGTLESLSRDEVKAKILSQGGRVANSVTKKTDYLIYGENSGSKLIEAEKIGTTKLTEKQFLKMVGN